MKYRKHRIKITIIIIMISVMVIIIYIQSINKEVKYVKSDIDNEFYLVRDLTDSQQAANMLARIKNNMLIISAHLEKFKNNKYKRYEKYIDRLTKKLKYTEINERGSDDAYTSYSINKGEQIVFCLRSNKNKNRIHDINLIMYVALHEMGHVASPEYGHTKLFKEIFAFLTQIAIELNIYKKMEFKQNPTEYCGLTISDSII